VVEMTPSVFMALTKRDPKTTTPTVANKSIENVSYVFNQLYSLKEIF
jgi:hypothetical protein